MTYTKEKLKTLKDFDVEPCCHGVSLTDLKAEAVKWVKELRRKTGTNGRLDYRLSFKHFFNLTEDDLK